MLVQGTVSTKGRLTVDNLCAIRRMMAGVAGSKDKAEATDDGSGRVCVRCGLNDAISPGRCAFHPFLIGCVISQYRCAYNVHDYRSGKGVAWRKRFRWHGGLCPTAPQTLM